MLVAPTNQRHPANDIIIHRRPSLPDLFARGHERAAQCFCTESYTSRMISCLLENIFACLFGTGLMTKVLRIVPGEKHILPNDVLLLDVMSELIDLSGIAIQPLFVFFSRER